MRRRRSSNRSGQALVEFALTVPILMLLVVGIIEFGRLMSAYQTITDTAREAARTAVVADPSIDEDSIRHLIRTRVSEAGLDPAAVTDSIIGFDSGVGMPTTVRVRYSYRMAWLGPLIGWTTGRQTVSLSSATRMRQE